jgi:hypothetical protein
MSTTREAFPVTSRDQIAISVAKHTTPYLDHRIIGLGQGMRRGLKMIWYLLKTRTLYIMYDPKESKEG